MKSYNLGLGCWVPSGLAGKNFLLGKLGWATFNDIILSDFGCREVYDRQS